MWITGRKAQEQYDISGLDWVCLVRGGLQPHYSNGDIMSPPDLDARRDEMVQSAFRVKDKRRELVKVQELERTGEPCCVPFFLKAESNPFSFESQISRAKEEIRFNISRLKSIKRYLKQSESGSWKAYEVPTAHKRQHTIEQAYRSLYEILGDALYKKKQVEQLVQGQLEEKREIGNSRIKELSEQEAEEFVTSLRVIYENDFGIKVQKPKGSAMPYTYADFGCNRETSKEWIALRSSVNGDFFQDDKVSSTPDGGRKIREKIEKRLRQFFLKEFGVSLPPKVKMYAPVYIEKKGIYQLKCQIGEKKKVQKYNLSTLEKVRNPEDITKVIAFVEKNISDSDKKKARLLDKLQKKLKNSKTHSHLAEDTKSSLKNSDDLQSEVSDIYEGIKEDYKPKIFKAYRSADFSAH